MLTDDDKALVERLSERITQAGIFRQAIMLTNGEARELRDRIEALIAENERLREALAHIAFSGADGPYGEFGEALNEHQMRRVAKAALKEQSK